MRHKEQLVKALRKWYEKEARHDLPWRKTHNMYHVYVSEVMLQQTQVSRVMCEYYPKFLARFPTLKSVAEAPLEEVHALWSGLGYYSRATNLHKTAKLTGGKLPHTQKELVKLPGIGRYTASAICSFGLNQAVAVVDTNIKRVLKRFFALTEPSENEIWQKAEELLDRSHPKEYNLALMDIGSAICTPKSPQCSHCPLEVWCEGKSAPELYTTVKKSESVFMELFYGIYEQENKIAFTKSKGPMYKGLLVLPECDPIEENFIGSFRHAYTKYRLKVNLYKLEETPKETEIFLTLQDALGAHISSLTKKALNLYTSS